MNERERTLLQRQSALVQRSTVLRAHWGADAAGFAPAFGAADLAADGWRWLRAHPQWPGGLLLLALLARPRRVWRWGWRALWIWRLWRRARPWVRASTGRHASPATPGTGGVVTAAWR